MNKFININCTELITKFSDWYSKKYKMNYDAIIYFTRNYYDDCHG